MNSSVTVRGPGALPVPEPAPISHYRSEPKVWPRDLEAWDLGHLIDLALKHDGQLAEGLVVELTPDEYGGLSGDIRRLFQPIRADPLPSK